MRTTRLFPLAALALALAALLVACGGDKQGSDATATASAATAAATARTTGTAGAGGGGGTGGGTGGGGGGGAGAAAFGGFCADYTAAAAQAARFQSAAAASQPTDIKTGMEQATVFLRALSDRAPADVKADFQVFIKAWTEYADAMAKANYDFMKAASDPAFQSTMQKMGTAEVQGATQNISAWMTKNCTGLGPR